MIARKAKATLLLSLLILYYGSAAAVPLVQATGPAAVAPKADEMERGFMMGLTTPQTCAHCGDGCTDTEHSCHASHPAASEGPYISACSGTPGTPPTLQPPPVQLEARYLTANAVPRLAALENPLITPDQRHDLSLAPPSPPPQ